MQVNQVRAGAILSYVSMAVSTILSLVYAPIMKGQLGTSEYGVYGSVGPIIAYLLLLSMGLGSAYMRYYSQAKVAPGPPDHGQAERNVPCDLHGAGSGAAGAGLHTGGASAERVRCQVDGGGTGAGCQAAADHVRQCGSVVPHQRVRVQCQYQRAVSVFEAGGHGQSRC